MGTAMNYTSAQVCAITGASYRCLDHWDRRGKLGRRHSKGSGEPRAFEPFEVVLVRACVYIAAVAPGAIWTMDKAGWGALAAAHRDDPALLGWRLVVEAGRPAQVARRSAAPAALVVNLSVCAADVAGALVELEASA
jgi:hypothetical protein